MKAKRSGDKRINLRLTIDEYHALESEAQKHDPDIKPGAFAKILLSKAIGRNKKKKTSTKNNTQGTEWLRIRISRTLKEKIKSIGYRKKKRIGTVARELIEQGVSDTEEKNHNNDLINELQSELAELSYQVSKIGGNLNQMAHYSHIVEQVTDEGRVLDLVLDVEDMLTKYIQSKTSETK